MTSTTLQLKSLWYDALERIQPILVAIPAAVARTVAAQVILALLLFKLVQVPMRPAGVALISVLCGCVGVVAIAAYRRWSRELETGASAVRWSRDHLWALGVIALIAVANIWLEHPSFAHPVIPLVGLALLVVGTQLFFRGFLLAYFLKHTGDDNLGLGVAIVLNAFILSAFAWRGSETPIEQLVLETLLNYIYLKSPAIMPVLVFFGAAVVMPNVEDSLLAGLIAVLVYYATMFLLARLRPSSERT